MTMPFKSTFRYARISSRKVRLVVDLIRDKPIDQALTQLQFSKKRAAVMVRKTLQAAIASADQAEADIRSLVVSEARVDEGPTLKRFQPKDRGRAFQILKRTSHIHISVDAKGYKAAAKSNKKK
jgi:large subunit ribosomal protein L22